MATKMTALVSLGYDKFMALPASELSKVLAILEKASIVEKKSTEKAITGLDKDGELTIDWGYEFVATSEWRKVELVDDFQHMTEAAFNAHAERMHEERLRAKDARDLTHPFRLQWRTKDDASADWNTRDKAYRTEAEADAAGPEDWYCKRHDWRVARKNDEGVLVGVYHE